ncbi:MAG: prepilin peptidase [Alphaproteobacteria bacterium]|nr:prepilin peptidase [Alphaproteobacteria bacterium]
MSFDIAVIHLGILGLAALSVIWAAVSDAFRYKIPNAACISLLVLFPAYVFTSPSGIEWTQNLLVFALVLVVGFFMFSRKLAGAGDVKLLSIVSLWAGPQALAVFLFVTALAGGLLGLVMAGLTIHRNMSRTEDQSISLKTVPIPYGVAIAVGGLASLLQLFNRALVP